MNSQEYESTTQPGPASEIYDENISDEDITRYDPFSSMHAFL